MKDESAPTDGRQHNSLSQTSRLATPHFKAVSTPHGRKALRLEAVFWTLVDAICDARGISRGALIGEIADSIDSANDNLASHLRSYVALYFYEEYEKNSVLFSTTALVSLLQQAPIACFAMSRDKRLLKVNRDFVRLLQRVAGTPDASIALETIQISIETPWPDIIEFIEAQGLPHQCTVTITVGNKQRRALARFVGLPARPIAAVVGYIVS